MNENDIYKLKYYKYKNKYIQLKNRYNQEGGEYGDYAFFLNKHEFNISYRVNNANNALLDINEKFYYPTFVELKKLPGLKAIIKNGQTIGEAFFPTLPKNKCVLSNVIDKADSTKLDITSPFTNNITTFFNKVNNCFVNGLIVNLCLVFKINLGKNELKYIKSVETTKAAVEIAKAAVVAAVETARAAVETAKAAVVAAEADVEKAKKSRDIVKNDDDTPEKRKDITAANLEVINKETILKNAQANLTAATTKLSRAIVAMTAVK
jgi:hypothetical protein